MTAPAAGSKRIGIIGAAGRVGQTVVQTLAGIKGIDLILAGRRLPDPNAGGMTARCAESVQLDLYDDGALKRFLEGLDMVINCAGPSLAVGDRIAFAALLSGADYLDPGGYDPLAQSLEKLHNRAIDTNRTLLFNAGLLPGMSALLPAYLVGKYTDRPTRLECIYVGTDRWTPASAEDIIDSLGDFGVPRPPTYIDKGKPTSVKFSASLQRFDIGGDVGVVPTAMMYTEELARLAAECNIPTVLAWGANHGRASGLVLALSKFGGLHRGRRRRRLATGLLVWASRFDARNTNPDFIILCKLEGQRQGHSVSISARAAFGDTYLATGRIAGLTARMMATSDMIGPGVGMLHEMVEPETFMNELGQYGYAWSVDEQAGEQTCLQ